MQIPGPKTATIGAIRFGTRSGIFRLVDTQFRREQVGLSPSAMPGVSDECFPDHCDDQFGGGLRQDDLFRGFTGLYAGLQ
jgi:hypothetical protein